MSLVKKSGETGVQDFEYMVNEFGFPINGGCLSNVKMDNVLCNGADDFGAISRPIRYY